MNICVPRRIETVLLNTSKLSANLGQRIYISDTCVMARKKSKQQGVGSKELVPGQQSISKSPVSPGDTAGGGGGDAGLDRLAARANQVTLASRRNN